MLFISTISNKMSVYILYLHVCKVSKYSSLLPLPISFIPPAGLCLLITLKPYFIALFHFLSPRSEWKSFPAPPPPAPPPTLLPRQEKCWNGEGSKSLFSPPYFFSLFFFFISLDLSSLLSARRKEYDVCFRIGGVGEGRRERSGTCSYRGRGWFKIIL